MFLKNNNSYGLFLRTLLITFSFSAMIFFIYCGGGGGTTTSDSNTLTLSPKMVDGTSATITKVKDCVRDSSGNIYCVGDVENAFGHKDIFVSRITSSHSLDTSWGTNGYLILNPGSPINNTHDEKDKANAIAIYDSDSLIIVGQSKIYDSDSITPPNYADTRHAVIIKIKISTQDYDPSFNSTGILFFDEYLIAGEYNRDYYVNDLDKAEDEAEGVVVDDTGNIYVTGSGTRMIDTALTSNDIFVLKLNNVGDLDANFGYTYDAAGVPTETNDGVFCFNGTADAGDKAKDIVIDTTNDRIYLAGSTQQLGINGANDTFSILKLDSNEASLVPAFGANGIAEVDIDPINNLQFSSEAKALVLNSAKTIVYATGTGELGTNGNYEMALVALDTTNGTNIAGFNGGDFITANGGYTGQDDEGKDIAIGTDGSIYVAGFIENDSNNDRKVWKFSTAGIQTGEVTVDPDGYEDELNCIVLDSQDNLILGGFKEDLKGIVWFQTIQ